MLDPKIGCPRWRRAPSASRSAKPTRMRARSSAPAQRQEHGDRARLRTRLPGCARRLVPHADGGTRDRLRTRRSLSAAKCWRPTAAISSRPRADSTRRSMPAKKPNAPAARRVERIRPRADVARSLTCVFSSRGRRKMRQEIAALLKDRGHEADRRAAAQRALSRRPGISARRRAGDARHQRQWRARTRTAHDAPRCAGLRRRPADGGRGAQARISHRAQCATAIPGRSPPRPRNGLAIKRAVAARQRRRSRRHARRASQGAGLRGADRMLYDVAPRSRSFRTSRAMDLPPEGSMQRCFSRRAAPQVFKDCVWRSRICAR